MADSPSPVSQTNMMTTPTQTLPERLRLAADIIDKNLPWEWRWETEETWRPAGSTDWLATGCAGDERKFLRVKLTEWPTLPPGDSWHNPAGLTREQFGVEYRPLTVKERLDCDKKSRVRAEIAGYNLSGEWDSNVIGSHPNITYRLPLETPWLFPAEPKMVPLEAKDVPPGSVFRLIAKDRGFEWFTLSAVGNHGLRMTFKNGDYDWATAQKELEILRPGTIEWVRCEKPSTEA